jgi:hypothetical protein
MYSEVGGALSWFGRPSCRRRLPSDESEILRYISKLRLAALVWFFLFFAATVQADCNPTFGQQVYDWVNNKAFGLSRQLADFDYAARILNYQMVSLDELHSTIHSASDNLDEIAVHIRTSEVISSVSQVASAINRDSDSQEQINGLFKIRAKLDLARARLNRVGLTISFDEFQSEGLGEVGRATLISAFHDFGISSEKQLNTKFSVYLQVSTTENGEISGGKIAVPKQNWFDYTLEAAAYEYPPLWMVYAAYEFGSFFTNRGSAGKR